MAVAPTPARLLPHKSCSLYDLVLPVSIPSLADCVRSELLQSVRLVRPRRSQHPLAGPQAPDCSSITPRMACFAPFAVAVLLLAVAPAPAHAAGDTWAVGRATFYDDNTK